MAIGNHYAFTNLAAYDVQWTLLADGKTLQTGMLDLDLPPDAWTEVAVPFEQPSLEAGTEYWLTVRLRLAADTPYADAGFEVAAEQFALPFDVPLAPAVDATDVPPVSVTESQGTVTVTGEGFAYAFDEEQGTLSSLVYEGTEVLATGPQLNLWRAPTLADEQALWGTLADRWQEAGLDRLRHETASVETDETSEGARVVIESTVHGTGASLAEVTYTYAVLGSGEVQLTVVVRPTEALRAAVKMRPRTVLSSDVSESVVEMLPRMGVAFDVPASLDRVQWYGRGPGGSFPDRPGGMPVGVYAGHVVDQFEPFVPPQISGIKTDVRWAALTSAEGETGLALLADPDAPFAFGVNPFANLTDAEHVEELQMKGAVTVTVDHALLGAGTKFHPPVPEARVAPEPVRFRFRLRPFRPGEHDPADLWK